jgi:hypothetical protein
VSATPHPLRGVPPQAAARRRSRVQGQGVDLVPPSDYAFVAPTDEGTGIDVAYKPVETFFLALALDIQNVGFKQSEIVFVMRYLRGDLTH